MKAGKRFLHALSVSVCTILFIGSPAADGESLGGASCASLPVVIVTTDDHAVTDRTRTPSWITVIDSLGESSATFGALEYSGRAEISVRGNSSYFYAKKPYRLELQDADGEDKKVSLLGMPAESDWILYPSFTDKTFVRNVLAHELSRAGSNRVRLSQFTIGLTLRSPVARSGDEAST